jgi:hypothetical protein
MFIAICCGLIGVLGIGLPPCCATSIWSCGIPPGCQPATLILLNRLLRNILRSLRMAASISVACSAPPDARRVHDYLKTPQLGVFFSGVFDDRIDRTINPEGLSVAGVGQLITECRQGRVTASHALRRPPTSAWRRLSASSRAFLFRPMS